MCRCACINTVCPGLNKTRHNDMYWQKTTRNNHRNVKVPTIIKSKSPLLISLQAESTDRPLHLSGSVGVQHTPLTQTFSSNKLTDSAASSRPGETLVRYRMMLEYTLHSNLIFFFKRGQVFFFASKIFSLLVGSSIYSTVDSQCKDDQPLFHSRKSNTHGFQTLRARCDIRHRDLRCSQIDVKKNKE